MKLEFKQYYESKKKLLEAVDSSPRTKVSYKLQKYCKVPLYEKVDSVDKIYYALKPDDTVEILWEYDTLNTPTVRYIHIVEAEQTFIPAWNSSKIFSWLMNNTKEL